MTLLTADLNNLSICNNTRKEWLACQNLCIWEEGERTTLLLEFPTISRCHLKKKKNCTHRFARHDVYLYIYMLYRKYMLKVLSYKESD